MSRRRSNVIRPGRARCSQSTGKLGAHRRGSRAHSVWPCQWRHGRKFVEAMTENLPMALPRHEWEALPKSTLVSLFPELGLHPRFGVVGHDECIRVDGVSLELSLRRSSVGSELEVQVGLNPVVSVI